MALEALMKIRTESIDTSGSSPSANVQRQLSLASASPSLPSLSARVVAPMNVQSYSMCSTSLAGADIQSSVRPPIGYVGDTVPLAPAPDTNRDAASSEFTAIHTQQEPADVKGQRKRKQTSAESSSEGEPHTIRKDQIEAALRSKPQRGRKRENLSVLERLELTRTRNREHAKSTR